MKIDTPLSGNIEDPSVIDSTNCINVSFNHDLDFNAGLDGIKIYKVRSDFTEVEDNVNITYDENLASVINISKSNGSKFESGEEYKLYIRDIKSTDGASLKKEFIHYFTVDYSFNLESNGIADLNGKRSVVICISDIHLGANDTYAEITKNRESLVKFLNQIRICPNIKELVIIGDLIDEWFVPMNLQTFKGKSQRDFVKAVALNNKSVIDAINNIIQDNLVQVTYIPGNHDILIDTDDIETILPGILQARDVKGLGSYTPEDIPELIIEHSHRYNFYCAPDHSNRSITGKDSILPPGYFFTRMATSSVMQGRPKRDYELPNIIKNELGINQYYYFLYWNVWKGLITEFPVKEGLDDKIITTEIDGFTDSYSLTDILPYQNSEDNFIDLNLYKGIIESWDERQDNNLVPVKIPIEDALLKGTLAEFHDDQSDIQYLNNPNSNKRIVIFGHTHEARILTAVNDKKEKTVYVNSGTWIDNNSCTMTFVAVIPKKDDASAPAYVNLYQYSETGNIKRLKSEALINLK
jgi:UDP-2,3-diacylglucosamine pyrophosphatase LpxH